MTKKAAAKSTKKEAGRAGAAAKNTARKSAKKASVKKTGGRTQAAAAHSAGEAGESSAPNAPKDARGVKDRAIDAALSLSAVMGWDMVSLSDIAGEAGLSLADLCEYFDDKADILTAYGRRLDKKILEQVGAADAGVDPRDRLFEILMECFDLLNEDREALISILSSFRLDPKQAVISLPHLGRSMSWMLEAAGVSTDGIKGALRVAGLGGVYLNAVRVWMKDDTPDMGKTMAALDKSLKRAEQVAGTLML